MTRDSLLVMIATFNRTEYAIRTIRAIKKNLKYNGDILYYLADGGSTDEHHNACLEELGTVCWGSHLVYQSPGANWNQAIHKIFGVTDFMFRLEDDFELSRELDITPYVTALKERTDWGIIRLGLLPVGLDMHSVGHNGIHYLQCKRSTQYAYSGNPLIMHKRFWDHYGQYHIDMMPGTTELEYDNRFREKCGPEILWVVDLGGWGIFSHIGERKSI